MSVEIERKFLTTGDGWRSEGDRTRIRQGYLRADAKGSIRIRIVDDQAILTLKGPTQGISRSEFEYEIPSGEAEAILKDLCVGAGIEKWRTRAPWGDHVWEIDEFLGDNKGLVVAEIELTQADEPFEKPEWLGEEVSHDPRFFNASLAHQPYCEWKQSAS